MGTIIGGLILQAIGGYLIYGSIVQRETAPALILMVLGIFGTLGGLYFVLSGLRKFFLADVMTELRRIGGPAAVVAGFKKCTSCTMIIPEAAKICRWCGKDDFEQ